VIGPKLKVSLNTANLMRASVHGHHVKDMIVLHETVSGDQRGLGDIRGVESYLSEIGYGIHGMTDKEGYIAWALGLGDAVFYHAGGVNERSIGIEQVFRGAKNQPGDKKLWTVRQTELRATAKLIAAIWRAHPHISHRFSGGNSPGVTSHWNVTQHFTASQGHWDCHPVHEGGYYPILSVIAIAKLYYKTGLHF
jgi:hypothetical protein